MTCASNNLTTKGDYRLARPVNITINTPFNQTNSFMGVWGRVEHFVDSLWQ